jgi:hydroxymethylglutaryl-CoA lyase
VTPPGRVDIVETGPRDGLQNEATILPAADKVELVARAVRAGVRRIEVTSFVSPRAVPALADADEVVAALPRVPGVRYAALVANLRGVDRALAAGVDELDYVVLCTDTFSLRNQGVRSADALAQVPEIARRAHGAGRTLTVTLGASFGCPFEGEVPLAHVLGLGEAVLAAGADELAYADTVGVGTPDRVRALVAGTAVVPRFHFHNTRNTGYANAAAALDAGVTALDATTGGIGGCPFAPDATGNIATEDLWYLAERMGFATGLDVEQVLDTARWTGARLGAEVPGLLSRAGVPLTRGTDT